VSGDGVTTENERRNEGKSVGGDCLWGAEKPESAQWHQKDTISHFCKTIYAKNGSVLAIFLTKTPPAGNTPILTRHVTL